MDGDVLSLDEFEDKKIVLNFFASWCPHCKEETPHLIQFKKAHEDVVVLMMNLTLLEDQFEDFETFQKVYDVNLPILIDEKGDLLRNFRIQGTPYNVFLDKEHVIKNIIPGGMNYEMLERQIESLD